MAFLDKPFGRGSQPADDHHQWWERGRACLDAEQYDEAIACFNKALHLEPQDTATYHDRGTAYLLKGDYDAAITDFTQFIHVNQGPAVGPANSSAADFLESRDWRKALAIAHANLGAAHSCKGNHDTAIADYTESIQIDPGFAFAFASRGKAYASKQDHRRAIADYTEAIRLEPSRDTYANRAKAFRALGDEDNAAKDEHSISARDCLERAEAYFASGNIEQAIGAYTEAIRLNPASQMHAARARAFQTILDYDRAIADYTEAIRLDPQNGLLLNLRSHMYRLKGDEALAEEDERRMDELRK